MTLRCRLLDAPAAGSHFVEDLPAARSRTQKGGRRRPQRRRLFLRSGDTEAAQ